MNERKFDNKGSIYSKARPAYPITLFDYLCSNGIIDKSKIVADIGSGTGIFTVQISEFTDTVYAVEPNEDMRSIAEKVYEDFENIISINGTAENSSLKNDSIDVITVAQAFNWFDRVNFKKECQRILKSEGKVVLLWNDRDTSCDIVKENFAVNKEYCPAFKGSSNGIDFSRNGFRNFFEEDFDIIEFENEMEYDRSAFIKRNLSSSYAPLKEDYHYDSYINALNVIFDKYQENGTVKYPYITRCYVGKVDG